MNIRQLVVATIVLFGAAHMEAWQPYSSRKQKKEFSNSSKKRKPTKKEITATRKAQTIARALLAQTGQSEQE